MSVCSGTSNQGTIAIPFIYLKARGHNSTVPMKKAQLPSNLRTLLKICNRLFKNYGQVKSLFTSDGVLVKNISDVTPGATLYVSNRDPEEIEAALQAQLNAGKHGLASLSTPPQSPVGDGRNDPKGKGNRNNQCSDSFNALFGQGKAKLGLNLKDKMNSESSQKSKRSYKPVSVKSNKNGRSNRNGTDGYDNSEYENENSFDGNDIYNSDKKSSVSHKSLQQILSEQSLKRSQAGNSVKSGQNGSLVEGENSLTSSGLRHEDITNLSASSSSSELDLDATPLVDIFNALIGNDSLTDDVIYGLKKQDSHWARKLLAMSPDIDELQMLRWLTGLRSLFAAQGLAGGYSVTHGDNLNSNTNLNASSNLNGSGFGNNNSNMNNTNGNGFGNSGLDGGAGAYPKYRFGGAYIDGDGNEIYGKSYIQRYIREIILRHRFVRSGGVDYNLRLTIVGPRNSGKSTLLSCFAEEIMLELATTGCWRQFFLFPLNFKLLATLYGDFAGLYTAIVDITLSNLTWQAPSFVPHMQAIRKLLLMAIYNHKKSPPAVSKSSKFYTEAPQFATAIQRIAQKVFELYTDEEAMPQFMTAIYLLPSLVANAAGFAKVIFFIDNIEFADVELFPAGPFDPESANNSSMNGGAYAGGVYNIEFLQFALSNQHFIISGQEQRRIFESLSPLEDGFDLENGIEFVPTHGIIPVLDDDNRLIKCEIQDEPIPLSLTVDACCGVPAFVGLWEELNDLLDGYEEMENSDEKEDELMVITTSAQHAIDMMFFFSDKAPLFVTAVRRSAKECENTQ
ncbi:hypothetical protein TRFO_05050 [Tritrichomonas foetus]|uniref:Doublecortin domain-containing protein n=1 Tax=Tritrichomonas foetus TaxID=1144522 RepID=A0A1J4KEX3_9EUKA|nr:hypothetical protein TRFO_05050 [Tritrichomonas foetus]|eukprot:OHT07933.1 hypothetical protein TRFO_05050 [Tritrichomonas foetus]